MLNSSHRFHGRSSLRFVHQKGKVVRGEFLVLRLAHNPRENRYRAAVLVSRKVSKSAVVRNRIRRRLFEIVRRESGRLNATYDLVVSVRSADVATVDHNQLRLAVLGLLREAQALEEPDLSSSRPGGLDPSRN